MITLKNKDIQITLNPDLGAGLHSFKYHEKDVLRQTTPEATHPEEQSLFLMIPFCSYIKEGHFNYFGINRFVPIQNSRYPNPIHGDAWLAKWEVTNQKEDMVVLSYHHKKDTGFPFDYNATVTYQLQENALDITLSIYNPSELPMPCGVGVHPYFIHPETAQISFVSSHIWHHKTDPIFDRPYPTPKQWDFSKPRNLVEDFDTAFGGWDGNASVFYPEQNLKISINASDIFHHVLLYHPKNADFFCLEPTSNTPDAFNLAAYGVIGTGIQSVGEKQSLTKTIRFLCEDL